MALIFTADVGQPIKIGDNITVTVLRQKGSGELEFAVDAPRELYINRGEGARAPEETSSLNE